ncbi:hypothetical protein UFOVP318_22 [uncultured Caudovirales phage]|uniref:Uncharacterized protein n=1 Tax=uncultured Caudovirales phage TaxID=2100421 RepID=A0A6J5LSA0_9CAUD|nr:hypothetical protein UFOVP318_22 [uncultured Caudovirales phage]
MQKVCKAMIKSVYDKNYHKNQYTLFYLKLHFFYDEIRKVCSCKQLKIKDL